MGDKIIINRNRIEEKVLIIIEEPTIHFNAILAALKQAKKAKR